MQNINKIRALLAIATASVLSLAAHADAHSPKPYGADTPGLPNQTDPPRVTEGLVYVHNVVLNERLAHGQPLAIHVEGDLPDAAWQFLKLAVQRQHMTITVRALGTRDTAAMAIQVLKPFKADTTVTDLRPGTYRVVVQGRSKAFTRTVRVK